MAKFLSTAALDADTLKSNFVEYLKTQDQFKDYDYSGSNISALLDILIQNTMYNNHYLNMVGAEAFLDTAELRESIVSRAKELNYLPKSRTSARASVSVTIVPQDSPLSITIPKGYKFTTTLNNQKFTFVTNQNYIVKRVNSTYNITGVEIFEGSIVTEFFDVVSTTNSNITTYSSRFIMSSENIDTSSIEVYVTSNNVRTLYKKSPSLFGLTNTSEIYFIQGYSANQYEIVFGDGILGKKLTTGDIVEVYYRDTIADEANGINVFKASNAISGYSNISVVTELTAYGGSERENNSSIKFNAVRHFQVQERAVTEDDYKNIILTNFPEIQAVSAYGGEKVNKYGKVVISLKPFNSNFASNVLKNRIYKFLLTKHLSNEPILVDLEFFYVYLSSTVRYSSDLTALSEDNIKNSIINNILTLNAEVINSFNQSVYGSRISQLIQSADNSVVSNSTSLKMSKRISPSIGVDTQFLIEFDNQLKTEGVYYQYPEGHDPIVKSSEFVYTYAGTDYDCWIQDNGTGVLGIYTIDKETTLLLKTIGTVDYTVGKLIFTINPKYYNPYISINVELEENDILVDNNKYILLDSSDFNIKMVTKND